MKFIALLLLAFSPLTFASKILDESISVNPYALPGDSERNHLSLKGVRIHESNDFYGGTDKLVSEAMSLSVMGNYWKYFSTSVSYKGRYMQPILKTKNGAAPLPQKIGIYAEWVEVGLNQSITLFNDDEWGAIKLDGGVAYNDFGEHNFANIYREVHHAVGSPDETSKFGEKTYANFISSTAAATVIIPVGNQINLIGSYQVMNSEVFREDAQEASVVWSVSEDLAFSAKYSYIKQLRSDFYDLRNSRNQFIAAARFLKIWTPSIMYVSPFVKGDKHGQWYLSPLSLTWPF